MECGINTENCLSMTKVGGIKQPLIFMGIPGWMTSSGQGHILYIVTSGQGHISHMLSSGQGNVFLKWLSHVTHCRMNVLRAVHAGKHQRNMWNGNSRWWIQLPNCKSHLVVFPWTNCVIMDTFMSGISLLTSENTLSANNCQFKKNSLHNIKIIWGTTSWLG